MNPLKPINSPQKKADMAMLESIALALCVERAGGRLTIPISEIDRIAQTTRGLRSEIITSDATNMHFLHLELMEEERSLIIQ